MDQGEVFLKVGGFPGRIKTVHPQKFMRPVTEETRRVENPASRVGQPLPFGKVEFVQPQRVGGFIARRLALVLHLSLHESAGLNVERHRPNSELKAVELTLFRGNLPAMKRAAHKTYSTGENRGNGEGILCSLCLLLFKSGPDVKHFLDKYRTDPGLLTRDADSPLLLLSLVTVEAVQPPGSAAQAGTTDH